MPELTIRKTRLEDLETIMKIYERARAFMAANGNPRQWANNNWPPESLIRQDIADGHSYVAVTEEGEIAATFFYKYGENAEPGYQAIEDGEWIGEDTYGVLHRMAASGTVKGAATFCMEWCYQQSGHMRGDTHPDNKPMQGVFKKMGFQYCGIIHVVEDNDPRYAYERL